MPATTYQLGALVKSGLLRMAQDKKLLSNTQITSRC